MRDTTSEQIRITLSQIQLDYAENAGRRRTAYNRKTNARHKWESGHTENPGEDPGKVRDLIGARAEAAVSIALRYPWNGSPGTRDVADVGPYHVRGTAMPWHKLILHPEDLDDAPHILVTPASRDSRYTFFLRGWLWGHEGKLSKYWGEYGEKGRPAFWIPQHALRPMNTRPTLSDH